MRIFFLNTGTGNKFRLKILKIWKHTGTKNQNYLKPNQTK